MKTFADRFRRWYEHERDCNVKSLQMLESVPAERHTAPEFQKAVDRLAHIVVARRRWLQRLGQSIQAPVAFPQGTKLTDLPALIADTEAAWVAYLDRLDDRELARTLEWEANDGRRYRWDVEGILTQLSGHAWYHRGQIAQLVAQLGGKAVDTDYIFWCKLPPLDAK
ncbi:MAG TPA: DinB family protein [Gemmataceae bacterium]|nr:DinB family protein [Gemmataceae bacterium]